MRSVRSWRSVATKLTAAVGGGYVLKSESEHLSQKYQKYQKYHSTTIYVLMYDTTRRQTMTHCISQPWYTLILCSYTHVHTSYFQQLLARYVLRLLYVCMYAQLAIIPAIGYGCRQYTLLARVSRVRVRQQGQGALLCTLLCHCLHRWITASLFFSTSTTIYIISQYSSTVYVLLLYLPMCLCMQKQKYTLLLSQYLYALCSMLYV